MRLTRGVAEIQELGRKLRDARLAKGFTAQELADLIDVTAQQIRRFENGKAEPGSILLARIIRALEIPNPNAPYEDSLTHRLLSHVQNDKELTEQLWEKNKLADKLPESKTADFKAKKAILKAMNLWKR